jgi:nucleoside-diphosphate-sugar epimerase
MPVRTLSKEANTNMANCLVTGGAGFIGSHIVDRLVGLGHKVRVLDDLSTGDLRNLHAVRDRIEFLQADVADPAVCWKAVAGMDWIFHQAAAVSVPFSVDHPEQAHRTNVDGTFYLLDAARHARVQRFVLAASSSAYGDDPDSTAKAETNLPRPLSPYAVSKITGENYCRVFALCYGMSTVALRYFNVFGPRQNPKSQYAAAIPAFITMMLADKAPTIYGDGQQTRDFTYIENVVDANLLAVESQALAGQVINVATGRSYSINALVDQLNHILAKHIRPTYAAPRAGDVKHSQADISLAGKLLKYKPLVSFEEGLARTVRWYIPQVALGPGAGPADARGRDNRV